LEYYKNLFNSIGWFIPASVNRGMIQDIAREINASRNPQIEDFLQLIYSQENMAAMVTERYPEVPFIQEYKRIISESLEAHFSGLDHVAVAGLMPVIEGVGQELIDYWGIDRKNSNRQKGLIKLFSELIENCREHVISKKVGMVSDIVPALDAFEYFLKNNFYVSSIEYKFPDKTNRHGILHGAFKDNDYGEPLNFYKTIGAVEFLSFIISLREPISFFAPSPTERSAKLAELYKVCSIYKELKSIKKLNR
jgi:hypothetical protein